MKPAREWEYCPWHASAGEPEHKAISGVREQRRHGHRNEGASHCFARCFAALRASAGFLRSRVPSVVTAPLAPGAKVPSETQTQHHPAPQGLHTLRRSRRACRHPSQCWRCQAIIELRSFGKLPPKLHCSITAQTCSHDWHQQHSGTAALPGLFHFCVLMQDVLWTAMCATFGAEWHATGDVRV